MSKLDPVRFGILGAGRIAVHGFAPALRAVEGARLVAVASREPARGRALNPDRVYDDYLALLDDPDVDAVYIAAHNGLHHSLTLAALERGKHVLCEKPLACTEAHCAEMIAAAKRHQRLLMEAFMYRYHPRLIRAVQMVHSGEIGRLKTVEAVFRFRLEDESNPRFRVDWGGGAAWDVGCYCVDVCRLVFADEPRQVKAVGAFHPVHQIDMSLSGVLDFGEGRSGFVSCGFDDGQRRSEVTIAGDSGVLHLPLAFPNNHQPTRLILEGGADREEWQFEPVDLFRMEIEDFAGAIRSGSPPLVSSEGGRRNARIIQALLASARQEAPLNPSSSPPGK